MLIVLRNTRRLASKLDRNDISEWLEAELSGYKCDRDLPEYRVVDAMIGFNVTGPVPPGFGILTGGMTPMPPMRCLRFPIIEPISAIVPVINNLSSEKCLYRSAEEGSTSRAEIGRHIAEVNGPLFQQITFLLYLNQGQVKAIPDRIKDTILKWALALEAAGVKGDGISFSAAEKQISQNVIFNFSNSIVGQVTNSGTNQGS